MEDGGFIEDLAHNLELGTRRNTEAGIETIKSGVEFLRPEVRVEIAQKLDDVQQLIEGHLHTAS